VGSPLVPAALRPRVCFGFGMGLLLFPLSGLQHIERALRRPGSQRARASGSGSPRRDGADSRGTPRADHLSRQFGGTTCSQKMSLTSSPLRHNTRRRVFLASSAWLVPAGSRAFGTRSDRNALANRTATGWNSGRRAPPLPPCTTPLPQVSGLGRQDEFASVSRHVERGSGPSLQHAGDSGPPPGGEYVQPTPGISDTRMYKMRISFEKVKGNTIGNPPSLSIANNRIPLYHGSMSRMPAVAASSTRGPPRGFPGPSSADPGRPGKACPRSPWYPHAGYVYSGGAGELFSSVRVPTRARRLLPNHTGGRDAAIMSREPGACRGDRPVDGYACRPDEGRLPLLREDGSRHLGDTPSRCSSPSCTGPAGRAHRPRRPGAPLARRVPDAGDATAESWREIRTPPPGASSTCPTTSGRRCVPPEERTGWHRPDPGPRPRRGCTGLSAERISMCGVIPPPWSSSRPCGLARRSARW